MTTQSSFRKILWDHFYALIITDILVYKKIASPTLKALLGDIKGMKVYFSLIEDLKVFFNTSEKGYLIHFIEQVIKETHSEQHAEEFINSILTIAE